MKLLKLTGLYGAAAIALLLSVTSCKKSSSISAAKLGTFTFQLDGKTQTLTALADTNGGGGIEMTAFGHLAGSQDSIVFYLEFYNANALPLNQYMGPFSDTASIQMVSASYFDYTLGTDYFDDNTQSVFVSSITADNGSTLSGNFKGNVWIETGYSSPGPDSLVIANGSFSVQYQ